MSRPESCATCGRMVFRHGVTCDGPCGLTFHLTCTALQLDTDPAFFDELSWLCDGCRLFLQLPAEVWTVIFNQLDVSELLGIRLTCHAWKQLVDESPTLRLRLPVRIIGDYTLDYDPGVPPASKVIISVTEIKAVDSWWPAFGAKLVSLELNDSSVSLATLLEMLRQTPLLNELALNGVSCLDEDVRSTGANFRLDNLEKLVLSAQKPEDRKFVAFLLKTFARMCPLLKYLAVDGNPNRRALIRMVKRVASTLRGIKFEVTNKVLEALTKLTKLQLRHVTLLSEVNFKPDTVVNFLKAQRDVKSLCICPETVQLFIEELSAQLKLVSLKIELDYSFTLNIGHMPTLNYLELTIAPCVWFGRPTVQFSRCNAPNLKELRLFGLQLKRQSLAVDFLAGCPQLQLLRLAHVATHSLNLKPLSQPFNAMKVLKIDKCDLYRLQLFNLFRLCPNLEDLELIAVPAVQDDVVLNIVKRFRALRRLALSCQIYGASAYHIINNHGPDLRQLDYNDWGRCSYEVKMKLREYFTPWCRVRFRWGSTERYHLRLNEFLG